MRCPRLIVFAVVLAWGSGYETARAISLGTEFTYQGELKESGLPADGDYDFVFRLYDAAQGGLQVGSDFPVDDWPVSNGLFTAQLDFGVGAFNGNARWLEVAVRASGGGGPHTVLSPRQPVTAAPVALYALNGPGSGGYWTLNGDHIYNNNVGYVGIGTSSPSSTLDVRETDLSIAAAISGYHANGYGVKGSSDDGYGVFGASGGAGGIGVYGFALGADSTGVFGVSLGEGGYAGYFNGRGCFQGYVGIQVQDPQASLDALNWDGYPAVKGASSGTGVYGLHNQSTGSLPGVWGATDSIANGASGVRGFVNSTTPGGYSAGVRGHNNSTGGNGIGVYGSQDGSGWGVYGYTPSGRGVYGLSTGGVGVYGHNDDSWNGTGVTGTHAGYGTGVYGESVGGTGVYAKTTSGFGIYAESTAAGVAGRFVGNVEIVSPSSGQILIELGEGLDYAEGFDVSGENEITPGTVLVIDAEHVGQLAIGMAPYDRKVAGIVAGANGLGSAVRLGAGQYDLDVALAGRVYCNVDATYGTIQPGDLLTTSPTPGYAMKVTDHEKAQGAILGKAMQPLKQGEKGQILVLVTLQ
ncbi:MAG: hypothetical protein KKB50_18680 [Planctomycetes bacterium]|nr:hypothetical protein [Planctomycetota bacterium]